MLTDTEKFHNFICEGHGRDLEERADSQRTERGDEFPTRTVEMAVGVGVRTWLKRGEGAFGDVPEDGDSEGAVVWPSEGDSGVLEAIRTSCHPSSVLCRKEEANQRLAEWRCEALVPSERGMEARQRTRELPTSCMPLVCRDGIQRIVPMKDPSLFSLLVLLHSAHRSTGLHQMYFNFGFPELRDDLYSRELVIFLAYRSERHERTLNTLAIKIVLPGLSSTGRVFEGEPAVCHCERNRITVN